MVFPEKEYELKDGEGYLMDTSLRMVLTGIV